MSEQNVENAESTVKSAKVKGKRGRPRTYTYPSLLTCTVTGQSVKTNYTQFQKALAKSGKTYDEYIATYVSRAGRAWIRQQREKEAVAKETPVVTPEPEVAS